MEAFGWILGTLVAAPILFLFVDGFMNPARVESKSNEAMKAWLTIVGKVYFPFNRLGAWLRRILSGIRKA